MRCLEESEESVLWNAAVEGTDGIGEMEANEAHEERDIYPIACPGSVHCLARPAPRGRGFLGRNVDVTARTRFRDLCAHRPMTSRCPVISSDLQ